MKTVPPTVQTSSSSQLSFVVPLLLYSRPDSLPPATKSSCVSNEIQKVFMNETKRSCFFNVSEV
jgi:hypothetical protein